MTRIGIGLPNRRLEPGELDRILGLGVTDYVLYLCDVPGGPLYWQGVASLIHERQPEARIHVRIEARGKLDAEADAARVTNARRLFAGLPCTFRVRNEPNVESPGETPTSWRAYLAKLASLCAPGRDLWIPALSPSGNWLSWLEASSMAGSAFAGLDCHAYGWPSEISRVVKEYRARWAGPLLLTECNPGAGNTFTGGRWAADVPIVADIAREYGCESVCWFLWDWSTPDVPLPSSVSVRDYPEVQQAIRLVASAQGQEVPAVLETQIGQVPVYDVRSSFPEVGGRFPRRDLSGVKRVVVHHTVTSAPHTIAQAMTVLQAIQTYHVEEKRWPAIAYHLCLDAEGRIYWTNGLELVTYHAGIANPDSIGVALLGTYTTEAPPAHLQEQVRTLHAGLERELGRKLELIGHKDVDSTTQCPGAWWSEFVHAGEPSELPARWRPYGRTWEEVASNLLGVADDALATGRRMKALAEQQAALWGNR